MSDALKKYSRQPKIYLELPSKGKFYMVNPAEKSGTGELPVLSMTARDELLLRTPDALMNGEAMANSLKNCVPLIEDPWDIPIIDIDALLIAIRIATYGETMKMEVNVPKSEEKLEVEISLPVVLDTLKSKTWQEVIKFKDLDLHTQPLKFRDQNTYEQKTFETSKFIATLRSTENAPDEQRRKQLGALFDSISDINIDLVRKQIIKIVAPEGEQVTDQLEIGRWLNDLNAPDFEIIRKALDDNKSQFDLPLQTAKVPESLVKQGSPETVEFPLVFNNTSFFA